MLDNFNKLNSSLRSKGIISTLVVVKEKLRFEGKYLFTLLKLNSLKLFTKGDLVINHGKYKFNFYGGSDRNEFLYHAFWDKMFLEELKRIKDFVKKGETVIDIGGNLGFFLLILNDLVGADGKIYTFEPSSLLRKKLAATIQNNQINNATIVNVALGESEGSTTLHYNPKQSGLSSIVTNFDKDSLSEEIKVTTLDKFSVNIFERVSFIKIDTEGFEPQVLKGAKIFIEKHKPTIYIELGGDYQATSVEALKILKELNYSCEAEGLDLAQIPAGANFIATPKN